MVSYCLCFTMINDVTEFVSLAAATKTSQKLNKKDRKERCNSEAF